MSIKNEDVSDMPEEFYILSQFFFQQLKAIIWYANLACNLNTETQLTVWWVFLGESNFSGMDLSDLLGSGASQRNGVTANLVLSLNL